MTSTAIGLDEQWMRAALVQAQAAGAAGEVPVGAVVVCHGQIIGTGQNAPIHNHDPSAHAEIVALRSAALHLGNYRLDECELFVTLEPCAMCAGAMLHARLKRVVFGAPDPKTGAAGSAIDVFGNTRLNHHTQVQGGVLVTECAQMLQRFFKAQRQLKLLATCPLRDDAVRTPEARFETLPPMPGVAMYVNDLPSLKGWRLHYVDAGSPDAPQVTLCLHGRRSWSQAWRDSMSERVARGERVLALDLIGFGKSDKPKRESAHSLAWHAQVVFELLERLGLKHVVVLEPAADPLQGKVQSVATDEVWLKSLSDVLTEPVGSRCVRRELCPVQPMGRAALQAPYPDQGHQAALRAFDSQATPQGTRNRT